MVSHENSRLAQFAAEPRHMVEEYPLSSTLVVFGVGLGAGLLLSSLLADPVNSAMHYMSHQETTTERMRRQLMDAFHGVLPAVMERFNACTR